MNNRKFTKGVFYNDGFRPEFDSKPSGRNPYKQGFKLGYFGSLILVFVLLMIAFFFLYNFVPEVRYVIDLFI